MRILILGGTRFLGRALAEAALARGHQITLFNRGNRPGLYPQAEEIHGDREKDLSGLAGRRWDAVIDTSGYLPGVVRRSVEALAGAVGQYTFVSSISVYASFEQPGMDESAPLAKMPPGAAEALTEETYGALKVLCEQVVEEQFGARAFLPRPGYIVGMYDPTDRFTYWPHRVAQGGELLAPVGPEYELQFIDVRDLSDWMLNQIEQGGSGAYNATGPRQPLLMGELLETCVQVSGSSAQMMWVPEDDLFRIGARPWIDLPMWEPSNDPQSAAVYRVDISKALAAGLTFRPLAETVRETLAWDATRPEGYAFRFGMDRAREQELLRAYRQIEGEPHGG